MHEQSTPGATARHEVSVVHVIGPGSHADVTDRHAPQIHPSHLHPRAPPPRPNSYPVIDAVCTRSAPGTTPTHPRRTTTTAPSAHHAQSNTDNGPGHADPIGSASDRRRPTTSGEPPREEPPSLLQAACDGRARPAARDPRDAVADDPLPRLLQREDGRQGARHRQEGRHPARQPRGRRARRAQGGRARGPHHRRPRDGPRRHRAVDADQLARVAVGARRPHAIVSEIGHKLVGDHGPEGRGRRGTSTTSTACSPSSRRRPASSARSSSTRCSRPRSASRTSRRSRPPARACRA